MNRRLMRTAACAAALLMFHAQMVFAQAPAPAAPAAPPPPPAPTATTTPAAPAPTAAPAAAPADQQSPVFSQEQLDQILAPIALYPDQLLAQILMAATYPLEIVQADRWLKKPENAKLKGDPLVAALEKETWDPSVKSVVPFPQVLEMMSQNLDWTQKLGDAMLAQEQDVMASVQRLRQAAEGAGNLKTTEQQTVKSEGSAIVIQPADPQVVYVPAYNPQETYGTWPYPSYPPAYYPPPASYYPGYYPYGGALAFATGIAVGGAIWGWGNCNWGGGNVSINNNQFNNINRGNINAGRASQLPAGSGNFRHNPSHRGGVAYRDQRSRQNFQRGSTSPGNRQNFRGFEGAGGRGGAGGANRPSQGGLGGAGAGRPGGGANRPGGGNVGARPSTRPSGGVGAGASRPSVSRGTGAGARPATRQSSPAFSGMNNGRSANLQSNRGAASRSSMSGQRGGRGGGGGGGARGGGGGGRGGGGGGRGGGGGGRR